MADRFPAAVRVDSKAFNMSSGGRCALSCFADLAHLLVVLLSPFLPLSQDVLLGNLERSEQPLALDEVAGLASGHEVHHVPLATVGVGVNMVKGSFRAVSFLRPT